MEKQEIQELFQGHGIDVAFINVTQTQLNKSIMDAVKPVRELLKEHSVHDYATQEQGTHAKIVKSVTYLGAEEETEDKATLYRPTSGNGDPRIWFTNLKHYAKAGDVLVLMTDGVELFVVNANQENLINEVNNPESDFARTIEKMQVRS